jgi:hypothetical protein
VIARLTEQVLAELGTGQYIVRNYYIATCERAFVYLQELVDGSPLKVGGNEGIFGARQTIGAAAVDRRCPECGSKVKAGAELLVHRPSCSVPSPEDLETCV